MGRGAKERREEAKRLDQKTRHANAMEFEKTLEETPSLGEGWPTGAVVTWGDSLGRYVNFTGEVLASPGQVRYPVSGHGRRLFRAVVPVAVIATMIFLNVKNAFAKQPETFHDNGEPGIAQTTSGVRKGGARALKGIAGTRGRRPTSRNQGGNQGDELRSVEISAPVEEPKTFDAPTPTPQPNKGEGATNSETKSGSGDDPLTPIIQEVQEKYPDVEFVVRQDQGPVSVDTIIDQLKSSGQWEKLTVPQKKAVEALAESRKLNHELNSLDDKTLSQVANDVLTILKYDSNHNRFMAPSGQSLTPDVVNQKINSLADKDPALAEILQEILQAVQSDTSMDWKNIRVNTARFLQEKDPEKIRSFFVLLDIYRQWFKINGDPNPILHSLQITPFEVVPHGSVIAGSDLYFLTGKYAKLAFVGLANLPTSDPNARFKSRCDPNSPDAKIGCMFCYGYPPGMFFFIPNSSGRVEKAVAFVQASGQLKGENGINNYLLIDVITPDGDVKTVLLQSDIKNGPTPALALVKLLQDLYPKDVSRIIYVVPITDPIGNIGVAVNGNVHYPTIQGSWVKEIIAKIKSSTNNTNNIVPPYIFGRLKQIFSKMNLPIPK